MKSASWRRRDLIASLLVIMIGVSGTLEALSYELGTASRMGPGYFPLAVSVVVIVLGILIGLVDARTPNEEQDTATAGKPWRALIVLPISILVFAATVGRFGLAPAVFAAVFVSTLADKTLTILSSVLIALSMSVICTLVFGVLLGIQIRTFIW